MIPSTSDFTNQKNRRRESVIIESDSPDPSLLHVISLKPTKDYVQQSWKNGAGVTGQIAIYPPEKDFVKDPFFWRLSVNTIQTQECQFSRFPGYRCTTVILPFQDTGNTVTQPVVVLTHQGIKSNTNVKSLFPYTWDGNWETTCKVQEPPVKCLQLIFNPEIGSSRIDVDKLGSNAMEDEEDGLYCYGKKRLLGTFCLIYVVEGYVQIYLDEKHRHDYGTPSSQFLERGQTLLIERDEESSPSIMTVRPSDSKGVVGIQGVDATIICIQIAEDKRNKWPSGDITGTNEDKTLTRNGEGNTPLNESPRQLENEPNIMYDKQIDPNELIPSRRRSNVARRRSLVPYNETGETVHPLSSAAVDHEHTAALLKQQLSNVPFAAEHEGARRDSLAMLANSYDPTQLYEPNSISAIRIQATMPKPVIRDRLVIDEFARNSTNTVWINMVTQGLNEWIRIPVIVLRGLEDGPVVGVTAAVHGNELNGVPCIHRLASQIDVTKLKGTVVAVPCVNVVGYLKFQREFADGRDLNRQFPGKEDGFASQVYCFHLMHKILSQFNYMIDLHTASFGRVNSYYVRADMNDPVAAQMAKLQKSQIILHNSGQDGTMRSAAAAKNIKAITVEIGNPQQFQDQYIQIYTRTGGVLECYPGVNTIIRKGDLIARMKDMFGALIDEYFAPCTSMVIGRSSNPVAITGDRIIHLGVIKKKSETLAKVAKENY
ncbi:hypothetical protein BC941DRAFT_465833 [Chlamydoabsidia padenii]|nr:hypothetical protein BC941DRAFT_465833 [Chlamydoabsidia padenii]